MCVKDGTCTPRGVGLHPGGVHQGGLHPGRYTRGAYTKSSDFSSLFTRPNSLDVCKRRHLHAEGGGVAPGGVTPGGGLHPGVTPGGGYTRSSDFSFLFTRPNSLDVCKRRHLHAQGGGVTPGWVTPGGGVHPGGYTCCSRSEALDVSHGTPTLRRCFDIGL